MGKPSNKVKFIVFSDIQIEDWPKFSKDHGRLLHNKVVLDKVLELCLENNCPALFCGDLFDNATYLKNYTLNHIFKWFNKFRDNNVQIYCIPGNHDQCQKNTSKNISPNYISMLADIYPNNIIDLSSKLIDIMGCRVFGIPYLYSNDGFKSHISKFKKNLSNQPNILLIHTDLPGAKDGYGREIGDVENIPRRHYKMFDGFDIVLSGHIHKYQKLGKNVYMLGATHHQRLSDQGVDMGIFKLHKNMKLSMVPTKLPEFKYLKYDEEVPDDDNFYISLPKPEKPREENNSRVNISKPDKLVKGYMKKERIKGKDKKALLLKYLTNG